MEAGLAEIHAFNRRHGITYPVLADPAQKVARSYGVTRYPVTVLIDRGGSVHWVHQGFREGEQRTLERLVHGLLKSTP